MNELKWSTVYSNIYSNTIISLLDNKVKEIIDEQSSNCVDVITEWIDYNLTAFILLIYNQSNHQLISDIKSTHIYESISNYRSLQLFDIIADFPDSIDSIKELKDAAMKSSTMGKIGSTFKSIVKKRLLHPGASTTQILDFYILMIRSLRLLDSSDLILNYVAKPIREYLINRKDTVRCIITLLTNTSESNLQGELRKGGSLEYGIDEDDEENGPGDNWEPRLKNPDLSDGTNVKGLDVLATLVSIYGSTEIFISEYRSLLANKLLNNNLYHTDEEVAFVELLKLRFGEDTLHACEVMLHDMEESKRVNSAISSLLHKQSQNKSDDFSQVIDHCIISDNYWPNLQSNSFTHHQIVLNSLDRYQEIYTTLKKPRKVYPNDQLGSVDIELSFNDGSMRSFTVLPSHASLIYYINEQESINSQDLSELCQIDEADVRQLMSYWISRQVVITSFEDMSDSNVITYRISENQYTNSINDNSKVNFVNDYESTSLISLEEKEKQSLKGLEKYILSMLTNQESMTIERIHMMLKLLSSGEGTDIQFDMNILQFNKYLNTLIESNKIELIDRNYKLKL